MSIYEDIELPEDDNFTEEEFEAFERLAKEEWKSDDLRCEPNF